MQHTSGSMLLGTLTLLGVLVLGPLAAYQLFWYLWPARWTLLGLAAAAEWCFFIFWYRPMYEQLNHLPEPCEPEGFTPKKGSAAWRRFMVSTQSVGGVDPVPYLSQWFCNAPFEAIKADNVKEMLSYGFFYRRLEDMTGELAPVPDRMLKDLERVLGVKFPPGYTPGLKFMSHLWEDLRAHYRPLLLYVAMEVIYLAQRLIMAGYGFKHKQIGQLGVYTLNCGIDWPKQPPAPASMPPPGWGSNTNAGNTNTAAAAAPRPKGAPAGTAGSSEAPAAEGDWTPFADPSAADHGGADGGALGDDAGARLAAAARLAASEEGGNPLGSAVPNDTKSTPVLFLHGVGGLMLYLEMLKHVIALGHPVIVVEYKHVGMRLSSYIPPVEELTDNVVRVLDHEGIPKVCIVGHSYGSFMASRLNMCHSDRVHSLCVIDPVALGMFMPHLLHNFMYRRPRLDWKRPDILARDLVLWFASRDLHVAATFARRFYWTEINMWPQDLPPGSCIVLSGNDDLCHAEEVQKVCEQVPGIKVILNPALFHGAFLLSSAHKAHLMAEVAALLATSGSLVMRMARPVLAHTLSAAHSLLHHVDTLTTRLSISPQQPLPSGAGGAPGGSNRRSMDMAAAWRRMSSLRGSISKRLSVSPGSNAAGGAAGAAPAAAAGAAAGGGAAAAPAAAAAGFPSAPTRSASEPLASPVASASAAAAAAAAAAPAGDGAAAAGAAAPKPPGVPAYVAAAAAAAAAECGREEGGTAGAGAGGGGAVATSALAARERQRASSGGGHIRNLSTIMSSALSAANSTEGGSGSDGVLVSGGGSSSKAGSGGGASKGGGGSRLANGFPGCGSSGGEEDWELTPDQNELPGGAGSGSGGGSGGRQPPAAAAAAAAVATPQPPPPAGAAAGDRD